MKFFSKSEIICIVLVFLVLIAMSLPNFQVSIRRARDQVRMDDIGYIQSAADQYFTDNGFFPISSPDNKIVICKASGPEGLRPGGGLVPCDWGQKWVSPVPGGEKVYLEAIPNDPYFKSSGVSYLYFSDGGRYQIYGAYEGTDEAGYDAKLAGLGIKCGTKICNFGRSYNISLYDNLAEYDLKLFCGSHPGDAKCPNKQIIK